MLRRRNRQSDRVSEDQLKKARIEVQSVKLEVRLRSGIPLRWSPG
jgi:hypothetical protein